MLDVLLMFNLFPIDIDSTIIESIWGIFSKLKTPTNAKLGKPADGANRYNSNTCFVRPLIFSTAVSATAVLIDSVRGNQKLQIEDD